MQAQLERVLPSLADAKRKVSDLESDSNAASAKLGAMELKLASEQEIRRSVENARNHEKSQSEAESSNHFLQIEALEGRQQTTAALLAQTRTMLNEKIDEFRNVDRLAKESISGKNLIDRRYGELQEEHRRQAEQIKAMNARHLEFQERADMLSNALAAKDCHIEDLLARIQFFKTSSDETAIRFENERAAIDLANRKLIEEVQSERAERALAQGALSIARASREKLLAQIADSKRNRIIFPHQSVELNHAEKDANSGGNITRLRASESLIEDT